jgi:hypothetical protein
VAQPDVAPALLEQLSGAMEPGEQKEFASLLALVANGYNPTSTATMADVGAVVGSVKWLCPRWVPYGMLSQVIGPPGVGKSAFVLGALVAPIITGRSWFSGAGGLDHWRPVVWCDTESCMAPTLERIRGWGLPAERILVPFADDVLRPLDLEDGEHIARLHTLVNVHRPHLLVIDSLRGSHKRDENCSRMAGVLGSLAEFVQRTGIACVLIHHTRKVDLSSDITADDARGSNAITALVRCQIALDKPDPKSEWVRFQVLKENLGKKPPAMGFRWGDNGLEFGPAPERSKPQTKTEDAVSWLRAKLASGEWVPCKPLLEEAEQVGYSRGVIEQAQQTLGIQKPHGVRKVGNVWEWRLPPAPAGAPVKEK